MRQDGRDRASRSPPAAARPGGDRGVSLAMALVVSLASIAGIGLLLAVVIGVVYLALASSDVVRGDGLSEPCQRNLKAIGAAMLAYHNDNGRFPPACIYDEQGRPMHSWHVLLLPYLNQQQLFQQYNMSLPYGDPQNQLIAWQMPAVYHCPESLNVVGNETSYMVVTGPSTVFDGRQSRSLLEILDGAGQTLLVAETTGKAINWLEPTDLSIDSLSLTINNTASPGLGSQHPGGKTHVLMADGSVRTLDNLTPPEGARSAADNRRRRRAGGVRAIR